MLASTVDIENVDGVHSYSLNADTGGISGGGTSFSPLNDFDVTVDDRAVQRYKMQEPGQWPTRVYEGVMQMHVEGSLFGDTDENYWIARNALLVACRGVPDTPVTHEKRGTLYVTPEGSTERIFADFGGFTFSGPLQANRGSGSDILITFSAFVPWFIGETSGNLTWWS